MPGGGAACRVDVAGSAHTADTVSLERAVPSWCGIIAEHLQVAAPARVAVTVHDERGVAWTSGRTVHLYRAENGAVDAAQLPHELVHAVAGLSPSRLLTEGLAVHVPLQLRLGDPCWPAYDVAPHLWLLELRRRGQRLPDLEDLVRAAQGMRLRDLRLAPGERLLPAWIVYLAAASLVGHLFGTMERSAFWAGYRVGAFWSDRAGLTDVERAWLESIPEAVEAEERVRLLQSLRRWGVQPAT